ncbi:cytosine/adenosine deaminase-related metal-dependent hydrolase [Microbacterium endophyticum]|uniref:Cytosine/adenosine deaminase-related metal-dependent hydrolase n=1 Tax=Microbacterium endophyticum TaxID=1526412 RepID=A0A7W4V2D8_9MICO|nr:amidohydrolase family protein [Microbacterium endophyticum]MBB2975555.1 cytosine/adenosine deaminase-related metal-dependent hydrolase [Microbacterium endophyticum]NIK35426.1 cytosine/adenosine deaminase-related metal-dependent hydrolase [Microbacterium endophyticum]
MSDELGIRRVFDTVIADATVVTMNPARDVVSGWIGISDGLIAAVAAGPVPDGVHAEQWVSAGGGIVHPGFVSVHQHTADTLARGEAGEAREFFDWLFRVYYESVLGLSNDDVGTAATLAAGDLRRAGITTVLDCWGVGDAGSARSRAALETTLAVAEQSGLRWIVAPMVSDAVPSAWGPALAAAAESLRVGFAAERLYGATADVLEFARWATSLSSSRVPVWTSAELPEMASDELLRGLAAIAANVGQGFTTHLCASEPGDAGVDGERAIARLERLGVYAGRTVGAHLTFTDSAERDALAAGGVGAAHCAASTMFGGGSHSALGELRASGVTVGFGLDNASLNTTTDMVGEMRHALAFDRSAGSGSSRLTAADALAVATVEGARVLGLDDSIGSIEVGKDADLVLVDTSGPWWRPGVDAATGIVLRSRADDIRMVFARGAVVHARG